MAKVRKAATRTQARPKGRLPAARAAKAAGRSRRARRSWLDAKAEHPLIDRYARQLRSFLAAMADGMVDEHELAAQEKRLVELMKDVEPRLDDELHARVTELLCELTAYDLMQVMRAMHAARPKTTFCG